MSARATEGAPMNATEKQLAYILDLWNRLNGGRARFLTQTDINNPFGLTKTQASALIGELAAAE